MNIIRAIVAGERNPDALTTMRDRNCKSTVETIRSALVNKHVFALQQALAADQPIPQDTLPKARSHT
ncbi:hypothetical protein [Azomonas macrocytogenes]|uniref:Uncharacterized protein n=1 Tax=Azomonas macrocytogenes TaxID=69962 RepID=A0A839T9R0_AZOMA|nr:hypothetical protein [Azomonas macrocytogenes]MBB3104924.1 hypothetical protein [Azomonas macrocytogenes]